MDRNQELLARIRQLQEREAEAEEKMKEQLERNRLCKQSLDVASRKLREKEDGLAEAGEVRGAAAGAPPCPLSGSPRTRACGLCGCDLSGEVNFLVSGFELMT